MSELKINSQSTPVMLRKLKEKLSKNWEKSEKAFYLTSERDKAIISSNPYIMNITQLRHIRIFYSNFNFCNFHINIIF